MPVIDSLLTFGNIATAEPIEVACRLNIRLAERGRLRVKRHQKLLQCSARFFSRRLANVDFPQHCGTRDAFMQHRD
ncbi:MAG: hypothetical protein JWP89_4194 [Schlesneria sp.]|nr:hypothetical protein [Schlesneria sp.]